jgi:AAA domain, putative AbiEii toxin, Type IV TA system
LSVCDEIERPEKVALDESLALGGGSQALVDLAELIAYALLEFIAALRTDGAGVLELETLCRGDRPEISLTVDQEGKIIVAPFKELSFGQKAAILLGVLLFSDRDDPLVIDQPEDHLDSAFISNSVVKTLRRVKERRQVIVATHNANIAVLGDAELIVPLRSWGGKGLIVDRGSVDSEPTRERACTILEGGEDAYRRRGEMYGLL